MRTSSNVLMKNMTSNDIDDVIQGKIGYFTRNAKSGVDLNWIFMKISEYLYFSTSRCCIVFGENRNSSSIQNGGPKFAKCAYLSEIFRFCSDFKTKYIFCNQHDRLIPKIYVFVCFSVHFRF